MEAKRSIFLDPNYVEGYTTLGMILSYAERPAEAIEMLERAIRLNPREYFTDFFYLGRAHYLMRRYEEAIVVLQRAIDRNPNFQPPWVYLTAGYSEAGYDAKARAAGEEVLRLSPDFSLDGMTQSIPQKASATLERLLAALRKAGLK